MIARAHDMSYCVLWVGDAETSLPSYLTELFLLDNRRMITCSVDSNGSFVSFPQNYERCDRYVIICASSKVLSEENYDEAVRQFCSSLPFLAGKPLLLHVNLPSNREVMNSLLTRDVEGSNFKVFNETCIVAPIVEAFLLFEQEAQCASGGSTEIFDSRGPTAYSCFVAALVVFSLLTGRDPTHIESKILEEKVSVDKSLAIVATRAASMAVWPRRWIGSINLMSPNLQTRLLYTNPLAVLNVQSNFMVLSWISPLDNNGSFMFSINMRRHSFSLLSVGCSIALSIPPSGPGIESLLRRIGRCSGRDVKKKNELLNFAICSCGWENLNFEHETGNGSESYAEACMSNGLFLNLAIAHIAASVETIDVFVEKGHAICTARITRACVRPSYWRKEEKAKVDSVVSRPIFTPRPDPSTKDRPLPPPYLSFLGSGIFSANGTFG